MKIWYITMKFPAPSETFAANDIRTLRRLGAQVSVHSLLGPWPGGEGLLQERDLSTLEVTHGGIKSTFSGLWLSLRRPRVSLSLLVWLVRFCSTHPIHLAKSLLLIPRVVDLFVLLEREPPDVVHLFWGHYPSLFAFLVNKYYPNIALSIFLGAYDLLREFPGTPDVAKRADAVWTHAHVNIKKIISLGIPAEKIHLAYRGIDLNLIGTVGCQRVKHRLVSAGRLIPHKGMEAVLATFRIIRNQWPDATLILLGDGPERPRLEKLACAWGVQDAVAFRGHVPHNKVLAEMAAAEIFLLLSRSDSERLPNVAKEAMASGCACIVTDTDGIDELITHGKSGFIVSQDAAPEEAAEIVSKIFMNDELRSDFQSHALELLRERFDVDTSMRKYFDSWSWILWQKAQTSEPVPSENRDGPNAIVDRDC